MPCSEDKASYSTSQPEPGTGGMPWESGTGSIDQLVQGFSFSQPACPEHMLVNSQLLGTPGSSQVRGYLAPLGMSGCCLAEFGARSILLGFLLAAFGAQLGIGDGVRVHLGGCSVLFGVQLCLMGNVREQLGNIGDVTFCYLSPQV